MKSELYIIQILTALRIVFKFLEVVPYELTGNVIYPVAQIINKEADELEQSAAEDFINFLTSDDAKTIFQKYYLIQMLNKD